MNIVRWLTWLFLLTGMLWCAGCVLSPDKPSYQVNDSGVISLTVPTPSIEEEILTVQNGVTVSRISFWNIDEEVYAILATPKKPRAAIVLAPGAGVKKEGHRARAEEYAREGIALVVLDIRGNGGETAGYPLDIQTDFQQFTEGSWPQYYAICADMIATQEILSARFSVPIFAMGESNGGRYAAIAMAEDHNFAGYIGISTSGFGLIGNRYTGNAKRFLLSIDPDHTIAAISPQPVLLFHSPNDSIIPYSDASVLFNHAGEPKTF
ncbi:MAG: alpha/beta hydrolase [Methanomicrobiales archaeon]|nr:alpha/beta hydrolase [Methanomicrobiales archaeon]